MPGAKPLPLMRHRVHISLESRGAPEFSVLQRQLEHAFRRLSKRLGGMFVDSHGSIGCLPGDGMTFYYDVITKYAIAWTYWGTDYGHPLEVEVLSDSSVVLDAVLAKVREELSEEFVVEITPGQMPERAAY